MLWREGAERRLLFTAGYILHAIDPATGRLITTCGDQGRVDLRDELDHDARGLSLAANAPGAISRDLIILGLRVGEGPAPAAPGGNATLSSPYVTTGYNRFLDPDGYPALRPPWGTLNAIDLNTGDYLWKRPLGESPELAPPGGPPTGTENYGGPVVTAGGVLFIAATKDEKFRAFSAATGEILWETELPAAGYATPATYEVGGPGNLSSSRAAAENWAQNRATVMWRLPCRSVGDYQNVWRKILLNRYR